MSDNSKVPLPNLDHDSGAMPPLDPNTLPDGGDSARGAQDLEAVFDVPVQVSAVLGRARMEVGELLKLGPGTVLELDPRSARRSTSMSTTGWWRAARWCWSRTSSA